MSAKLVELASISGTKNSSSVRYVRPFKHTFLYTQLAVVCDFCVSRDCFLGAGYHRLDILAYIYSSLIWTSLQVALGVRFSALCGMILTADRLD